MAKIYISYQRADQSFVIKLAEELKAKGHQLSYDIDELTPGTEWRTALDAGLKNSEVFIVIVSQTTHKSQYLLAEVGAARAYALESNRMLLIPILIDNVSLPLTIQDIQAIIQPDRNIEKILSDVERAIASFIGRRTAIDVAETAAAEKIQSNSADYIRIAIDSLQKLEKRDRLLSYLWYFLGFASLLVGIGFSLSRLLHNSEVAIHGTENLVLLVLKAVVVISLLGAFTKYAFALGRSYSSESLKSSDRIHAIRFGDFYLRAFGDKMKWNELKEVFQHWNIDRNSSFASLDISQFDPKLLESILSLINATSLKNDKSK